jgi:hypothetical protein
MYIYMLIPQRVKIDGFVKASRCKAREVVKPAKAPSGIEGFLAGGKRGLKDG